MARPPPGDFNSTLTWFRARVPMGDKEFSELRARATQRANEMAAQAVGDIEKQVAEATARAVRKGMNLDTAKEQMGAALAKAWGINEGEAGTRIDAVLRMNIQSAYSTARRDQMTDPAVIKARPFWQFVAKLDSGTTDVCTKLGSPPTILPAEHKFWDTHQPPLHFGCRSAIKPITKRAAEGKGISKKAPRVKAEEGFGEADEG